MKNKEASYTDEQLVKLARQGDQTAYDILLKRYQLKIHHIIHFYLDDKATVHDLAQEVLIKIFRYLHCFKEESQFSTWLYRITQNTIKSYFRAISQRHDCEAQFANEQEWETNYSPEYQLLDIELGEQVALAITRLSNELRQCYDKHIFEGQTYEDIAKEMHCPIGTVRSRIARARKLMMEFVSFKS